MHVEATAYTGIDKDDVAYIARRDSFIWVNLNYNFGTGPAHEDPENGRHLGLASQEWPSPGGPFMREAGIVLACMKVRRW